MHSIGGELIRNRIYEKEIGSLITFHTKNSYSFIDIGANIGIHSLLASSRKINEEQKILSIEPYEPIYEVLKKNIDANGFTNIIPINKGLGESESKKYFFSSSDKNQGRGSFTKIHNAEKTDRKLSITTLDKILEEHFPNKSSNLLLKIDVEGYEYFVLKGGASLLKEYHNISIICEMWLYDVERVRIGKLIIDFLKKLGFNNHYVINDLMYRKYGEKGFNMFSHKSNNFQYITELKDDLLRQMPRL